MLTSKHFSLLLLLGICLYANNGFATPVQAIFARNHQPLPNQELVLFMKSGPELFPTTDNRGYFSAINPKNIYWAQPETIQQSDCDGHLVKTTSGHYQLQFSGVDC